MKICSFRSLVVLAGLSSCVPAFALPGLPGQLKGFYEKQGLDISAITNQSCRLCHAGVFPNRGNLNTFGTDIQELVEFREREVDFSPINDIDSDGDGASNLEEFKAGTLPNDENSAP